MTAMERTLDRIPYFDERSKGHPLRAMLPGAGRKPRSYSFRHYLTNQGEQGACAGHAAAQEAAARPAPFFGDPVHSPAETSVIEAAARQCYGIAQANDTFPGAEPEVSGTSIVAVMEAGIGLGWWTEYRWALGPGPEAAAQDVIMGLGYRGPILVGSWWRGGMWRADADGFLNVSGAYDGGHGYLLTAYSAKRDAVWTPNSWGGAGQGWIKRSDLVTLLAEDGEAVAGITRRRRGKGPAA